MDIIRPYIAYGYNKDDIWIRSASWLPTQFFRLLISEYYSGEYNWKIACKSKRSKELFRETMELATPLLIYRRSVKIMPKTVTRYEVLISCPSDVGKYIENIKRSVH